MKTRRGPNKGAEVPVTASSRNGVELADGFGTRPFLMIVMTEPLSRMMSAAQESTDPLTSGDVTDLIARPSSVRRVRTDRSEGTSGTSGTSGTLVWAVWHGAAISPSDAASDRFPSSSCRWTCHAVRPLSARESVCDTRASCGLAFCMKSRRAPADSQGGGGPSGRS